MKWTIATPKLARILYLIQAISAIVKGQSSSPPGPPLPTKSCSNNCGLYRLEYAEDTCQCDAACKAADDCCRDFDETCPQITENPDRRKTKCHGYDRGKNVGVQTVVACPEESNKTLTAKCEKATEKGINGNYRANLMTDDMLLYIPVTTENNITYANLYCATCHQDAVDYDYWDVNIANISSCMETALKASLKEKVELDTRAWMRRENSSSCLVEGDISPLAPKKFKIWLKDYYRQRVRGFDTAVLVYELRTISLYYIHVYDLQ